jgi:hypothetical protein
MIKIVTVAAMAMSAQGPVLIRDNSGVHEYEQAGADHRKAFGLVCKNEDRKAYVVRVSDSHQMQALVPPRSGTVIRFAEPITSDGPIGAMILFRDAPTKPRVRCHFDWTGTTPDLPLPMGRLVWCSSYAGPHRCRVTIPDPSAPDVQLKPVPWAR